MSNVEDILFEERKKIDGLEKKINDFKARLKDAVLILIPLIIMWSIIILFAGDRAYDYFILIASILGLSIGSYIVLAVLYNFFKLMFIFDSEAPMVSKEESKDDYYLKRKLTACSDCMVVYDAKHIHCPECGKETMKKGKDQKEILQKE